MKIYLNRLLKGILFTGLSIFVIFHEYGTNYLGSNHRWREAILDWGETQTGFVSNLTSIAVFLMAFLSLIYLCKGVYYLCTCHLESFSPLDTSLAEKLRKPCSGYDGSESNIDKIIKYRDAKFSAMTNEQMVKDYKATAWLDSLKSNNTPNAGKAREYINSKLSAMDNETAYKWLKNHK